MRRSGRDSVDKAGGRRAHVNFEEMKRQVWQEIDEGRDTEQ